MTIRDPGRTRKLANELLTELQRDNRDQRFHKRATLPELHAMIGKLQAYTVDWSLGGMFVKGLPGATKIGDLVQVLLWDGHDQLRHHPVTCKIIRHEAERGGHAVQFVTLHPGALSWLSDLQRGQTLS